MIASDSKNLTENLINGKEEKEKEKAISQNDRGEKVFRREPSDRYAWEIEKLEVKRVTKVTKGGRRFSYTSLILIKDKSKRAIAFANCGAKEASLAIQKSLKEAKKKKIIYFPDVTRTIPRDVLVSFKATRIFLKPTPPGNGIKAGGVLNKLFKFLEIKDVSAKIFGSRRSKLNVIRTAFMALDKLTGKKYDY